MKKIVNFNGLHIAHIHNMLYICIVLRKISTQLIALQLQIERAAKKTIGCLATLR